MEEKYEFRGEIFYITPGEREEFLQLAGDEAILMEGDSTRGGPDPEEFIYTFKGEEFNIKPEEHEEFLELTGDEAELISSPTPSTNDPQEQELVEEKNYFDNDVVNFLEDIPVLGGLVDWIDDSARAVASGYRQGQVGSAGYDLAYGEVSQEDIEDYLAKNKSAQEFGPSQEMTDFNRVYEDSGGGVLGFVKGMWESPTVVTELALSSFSQLANKASRNAALATTGTFTGTAAATGTAAGPAGTVAGAIGGAVASIPFALGAAGGALEIGASLSEFIQEEIESKGLALDEAGIRTVLEDKAAMSSIKRKAVARGAVIGVIDAFTGKLATKVGAKVLQTSVKKAAPKAVAAGLATEGVGGGIGEASARAVAGQEFDAREVGFEAVGGFGPGAVNVANSFRNQSEYVVNGARASRQETQELIEQGDQAVLDNIEVTNDPELQQAYDSRQTRIDIENKVDTNLSEDVREKVIELEIEAKALEDNDTVSGKAKRKEIEQKIIELTTETVDNTKEEVSGGGDDNQKNTTVDTSTETQETPVSEKSGNSLVETPTPAQEVSTKPVKRGDTYTDNKGVERVYGEDSEADKVYDIDRSFGIIADGFKIAGAKRSAELLAKGDKVTFNREESAQAARDNELYNTVEIDGGVEVIGAYDTNKDEWVGVAPDKAPESSKTTAVDDSTTKGEKVAVEQPDGPQGGDIKPLNKFDVKEDTDDNSTIRDVVAEGDVMPVRYKGKEGVMRLDETEKKRVVFESDGVIEDLGNIDDIGDSSFQELEIDTAPVIEVSSEGNYNIRGKQYVNNFSDPEVAIGTDKDGNRIVRLDTPDGKSRTFRGQVAEDLAFEITQKKILDENPEQFEQYLEKLNQDETVLEDAKTEKARVDREVQQTKEKSKRRVNDFKNKLINSKEVSKGTKKPLVSDGVKKLLRENKITEALSLLKAEGFDTKADDKVVRTIQKDLKILNEEGFAQKEVNRLDKSKARKKALETKRAAKQEKITRSTEPYKVPGTLEEFFAWMQDVTPKRTKKVDSLSKDKRETLEKVYELYKRAYEVASKIPGRPVNSAGVESLPKGIKDLRRKLLGFKSLSSEVIFGLARDLRDPKQGGEGSKRKDSSYNKIKSNLERIEKDINQIESEVGGTDFDKILDDHFSKKKANEPTKDAGTEQPNTPTKGDAGQQTTKPNAEPTGSVQPSKDGAGTTAESKEVIEKRQRLEAEVDTAEFTTEVDTKEDGGKVEENSILKEENISEDNKAALEQLLKEESTEVDPDSKPIEDSIANKSCPSNIGK